MLMAVPVQRTELVADQYELVFHVCLKKLGKEIQFEALTSSDHSKTASAVRRSRRITIYLRAIMITFNKQIQRNQKD